MDGTIEPPSDSDLQQQTGGDNINWYLHTKHIYVQKSRIYSTTNIKRFKKNTYSYQEKKKFADSNNGDKSHCKIVLNWAAQTIDEYIDFETTLVLLVYSELIYFGAKYHLRFEFDPQKIY